MRKLFHTFILSNIIAAGLFSAEVVKDPTRPVLSQYSSSSYPLSLHENPDSLHQNPELNTSNQNFPFLSVGVFPFTTPFGTSSGLLPIPGIGLSNRSNGKATDLYFRTYLFANTFSWTRSKMLYKNSMNSGPYVSFGAGGFIGILGSTPCGGVALPLRAGIEGKNGFVDIGVEIEGIYLIIPFITPELRAGIQF